MAGEACTGQHSSRTFNLVGTPFCPAPGAQHSSGPRELLCRLLLLPTHNTSRKALCAALRLGRLSLPCAVSPGSSEAEWKGQAALSWPPTPLSVQPPSPTGVVTGAFCSQSCGWAGPLTASLRFPRPPPPSDSSFL